MKGFVIYPTYRMVDNKAYVHLYGRLENGESFLTINEFKPFFYIKTSDSAKAKKLTSLIPFGIEETMLKDFFEEPVSKVTLDLPKDVPDIRKSFEGAGIRTYEADIRFVYRFLIEKGVKGSLRIEGKHEKGEGRGAIDRIYRNPEIAPITEKVPLRVLSLDIETTIDAKEILCISLYGKSTTGSVHDKDSKDKEKRTKQVDATDEGFRLSLFNTRGKSKNPSKAESFGSEDAMLRRFIEAVVSYDPDIITGWNLIGFDLKVLKDRCDRHNIAFEIGRTNERATIKSSDSYIKDPTADIPGRVALDGLNLLKISFISLTDYKLQTAAKEILGDSKAELFEDTDKGEEIERMSLHDPDRLVEYNLKDSELVIRVLEEKNILDLTIQRSLLTGMQLDRVKSSIASLDNLYIREALARGYVCKTSDFGDSEERITGGYVRNSVPGIYDFIDVLDFKSLYPSIIRTFNIDPLSFAQGNQDKNAAMKPSNTTDKHKEGLITAPNGASFRKEPGILPLLIQRLWEMRDDAKKRKNKEETYAIKITMNSFFGVLANPTCRFYSLDMANAITHFGQDIVKRTAELAENEGYNVIYGDTDSIFVETKAKDADEAEKIGNMIAKKANKFWKEEVKERFGVDSHLELQFDKAFVRFIMPRIRGTEVGAKKRYAGLQIVDGKEKISFTGLEFVRRDWTELSKRFQLGLLDRIFHKKEVGEYVRTFVTDLKAGKLDDLLIYRKSLRKDLLGYTKTTPPHVKAARKLGKITSSLIAYVMTEDGPEPVQKIEHKLDYDHYIEKQLKPIADSVLVFYGQNFDDVLKSARQTSLFSF